MIYLIIFNVLLIIFLYIKFIHIPHETSNIQEFVENLDSALIGYIDDENGNPVDWILAEILELNRKKYITIDYIKTGIDKYHYIIRKNQEMDIQNLEKYELTAYRLLFDYCDEVTIDELEEGILRNVIKARDTNVKGFSIKNEIEEKLEELEILSDKTKKQIQLLERAYIIITIILAFLIRNIEMSLGIVFLIQTFIIFYMLRRIKGFTTLGRMVQKSVQQYKEKLEDNDLLRGKKIAHNIVLEKEYANATALHIMTDAKKEFINDEINVRTNAGIISSLLIIIYYIYWFIELFIGKGEI